MIPGLISEAHFYAAEGWAVLPLMPRTKVPATPNGVKNAVSDRRQIDAWFYNQQEFNIGIACGEISRLLVLDIDPRNGGDASFEKLERQIGPMPPTPFARTGGGGRHYYFGLPEVRPAKLAVLLKDFPGIDFKISGYVVAPPSIHETGTPYEWEPEMHPSLIDVAEVPAALLRLLDKSQPTPPSSGTREPGGADRTSLFGDGPIDEGTRNDTLFRIGCALRGRGAGGEEILSALLKANRDRCTAPLDEDEIECIAESCMRYEPDSVLAGTEMGMAEAFCRDHAQRLKFDLRSRRWLAWTGRHWQEGADHLARQAFETWLAEKVARAADDKARKALRKYAARSRVEAILSLASARPNVIVTADQLDTQPGWLPVENGLLELATGTLHPHDASRLYTRHVAIPYRDEAPCPAFLRFLDEVTCGDVALADYLQRLAGYAAVGDPRLQIIALFYGPGANGKSTFFRILRDVLGPFCLQAAMDTFLKKPAGGGIPNDLARLRSARAVIASEAGEGARLSEVLIKSITGGEAIAARHLYGEYFEFQPAFVVLMASNFLPELDGADPAVWRRVHCVPFSAVIPPERRDPALVDRLRAEREGILAWLAEGARRYLAEGLERPPAVAQATERYRVENDPVGAFLDEACELGLGLEAKFADLWQAFLLWGLDSGEAEIQSRAFARLLDRKGLRSVKRGGAAFRQGVRIKFGSFPAVAQPAVRRSGFASSAGSG